MREQFSDYCERHGWCQACDLQFNKISKRGSYRFSPDDFNHGNSKNVDNIFCIYIMH